MQIKQIEIENKIKEKLDKIRPFLKKDGGDAKFVSFKDNIAYI